MCKILCTYKENSEEMDVVLQMYEEIDLVDAISVIHTCANYIEHKKIDYLSRIFIGRVDIA